MEPAGSSSVVVLAVVEPAGSSVVEPAGSSSVVVPVVLVPAVAVPAVVAPVDLLVAAPVVVHAAVVVGHHQLVHLSSVVQHWVHHSLGLGEQVLLVETAVEEVP
jgi:hypothetical protein